MKTVGTFSGIVKEFKKDEEFSIVTLKDHNTGTETETTAITENLIKNGIGQDDKFQITVYQAIDGKLIGEIEKK